MVGLHNSQNSVATRAWRRYAVLRPTLRMGHIHIMIQFAVQIEKTHTTLTILRRPDAEPNFVHRGIRAFIYFSETALSKCVDLGVFQRYSLRPVGLK